MGDKFDELKRFLASHIEIDENGCHLWTHHINNCGYSLVTNRFYRKHGKATGHQLAWLAEHGSIPSGMCVLHTCDVRRCINPDHLWTGTHAENMQDMMAKGRDVRLRGTDHSKAKLTDAQVILIRAARAAGLKLRMIGEAFGITPSQVSTIALRKQWRHLP